MSARPKWNSSPKRACPAVIITQSDNNVGLEILSYHKDVRKLTVTVGNYNFTYEL